MLLGDFGTSYSKILDLDRPGANPRVLATRDLAPETRIDLATGHNARRFGRRRINELVALARGGEALIGRPDFLLLDCGSRDIKFIRYAGGRLADMGWNAECGASMGFTIELLARYYQLDCRRMEPPQRAFAVTCGVLGLSDIFDAVVNGVPEEEAVARLIKGIALNAYQFAGKPEQLYLSGGLCDNPVFVRSFPCPVVPLGRFVLLEGLRRQIAA
ncbi:ATPase [Desulfurivibrio sp. C05AmB]|uniref:ATPase n=1 Tax=Desulfurivibrio sp. C05AmB TaxID=3374371 RepID=UPI00376F2BBD